MSLSAIFVVQSALAMIFLAKGDFAFVSGCSTAVAAVVSRVLCCYVHIPQLLTVKPVLVNRVVFRIARASPTRLLMAVKDKYTRIKCSCQIKKKSNVLQCLQYESKSFLNEYLIFMDFQETFIWKQKKYIVKTTVNENKNMYFFRNYFNSLI